jgi:hypothetical protein
MAANTRQTNLLIQQDWKKIYQSFQNADFQSYDFETLRKTMIDYLRTYYPEDFNDFLESSEYVALIDLIAFLGQSLAFRTDLNARENFLDTAERRDSVLKLARLISYNPKRSIPSSGLLRFESVQTTEVLFDSTGLNLSNIPINWNDPSNEEWQEQFAVILNAAFVNSQVVGKPGNTQRISGIRAEEYSVNLLPNVIPAFKFSTRVEGDNMSFELVSATSINREYLYERDPAPNRLFNIIYRNDNLGNNSVNTGWFVHFKQGEIRTLDFTLTESLPNRVVSVNVDNINNLDVWVYKLDSAGNATEKWTEVPNVAGFNVIYNTSTERNIYQVNTRANDQVDIVFGDGAFANIPIGSFRVFYRVSNGQTYKITPEEMQNITLPVTYVSRSGRAETLTIRASLQYTVNNASARETLDEIKTKAPQQYYTQNRMVTGEDYNILPFTKFNNILKIKSTNRSSSGVSRYLDTLDVTGKYSSTNVFGADGVLYRDETIEARDYSPPVSGDLVGSIGDVLNNQLLVDNYVPFSQLVYEKLRRFTTSDIDINGSIFASVWTRMTVSTNQSTGFFSLSSNYNAAIFNGTLATPIKTGLASSTVFRYVQPGAIIRFRASQELLSDPKYFDASNDIKNGTPQINGDKIYLYATVARVAGDGDAGGFLVEGNEGPITMSTFVPSGAYIDQIIPKIGNIIPESLLRTATTLVEGKKNFGLRYDQVAQSWKIIQPQDLKLTQVNSLLLSNDGVNAEYTDINAGSTSSSSLDSSWVFAFVSGAFGYKIFYRQLNYVFESKKETKFYFDPKVRVYDSKSAQVISDNIKVLRSNSGPDINTSLFTDKTFFIYKMVIDPDGFENTSKILVKYPDTNRDGVPDNPDLFNEIVAPGVNTIDKAIFFRRTYNTNNYIQYQVIDEGLVETGFTSQGDIVRTYSLYNDGQIFYATGENLFYDLSVETVQGVTTRSLTASENNEKYLLLTGRQGLYFQYRHASPSNRRIDPSPNNIVDLYVLTKQYADDYQAWIRDASGRILEPDVPTSQDLQLAFADLENFKTISDTLIYNSARFKPLFGEKADPVLRARFKVVKSADVVISDNDIKVAVISAVNRYFDITNWDFGETFYFSELSAYLHSTLSPKISSIIIVPTSTSLSFGSLYQINAEPDQIMTSSATVDNVEVISAITAAQLQ